MSRTSAFHIMPLLARLVLAAAFLPVGWAKLTKQVEFTPQEARTLERLGVGRGWMADAGHSAPGVTLVSSELTQSATPPAASPEGTATGMGTTQARSLYRIALLLDEQGWPAPCAWAWGAALTELLGSAFLLVGLTSRFWAAGLCAVMGVAFWLTSASALKATYGFDLPVEIHNRVFLQAALFTLALGVALVGPGGASLDSLVFRRGAAGGGGGGGGGGAAPRRGSKQQ